MNYLEFDLNGIDTKELSARLSFDIATARNSDFSLVKYFFDNNGSDKFQKALTARLREIKKQGRIAFFVSSKDFLSGTTEAEYLFNKFPELKNETARDDTVCFFVKI